MKTGRRLVALLMVCLAGGYAGESCATRSRTSILLVVVDTVRADHLSAYGYDRATTPYLEKLAARGAHFTRVFAPAPWTLPSVASILTGLYPDRHGAGLIRQGSVPQEQASQVLGRRRFAGLAPGVRTLAQLLHDDGYATGAVVNNIFLMPAFQLGRGFDRYDFQASRDSLIRRADASVDAALQWLDTVEDERPVFLLVHLMDPHRRYDAPPPFRDTFSRPFSAPYGSLPDARLAAEEVGDRDFLAAAYDEEIAFVDRELRRLVAEVGRRRPTLLVAVTSDHGESFGAYLGHGKTLEDVLLRVPLILVGPGIEPRTVFDPVSLIDVTPTLLEAAGLAVPRRLDGISTWPALRGEPLPDRMLRSGHLLYGGDRRAVISWPYKLVVELDSGERRLRDLMHDPGETIDFSDMPSPEHERFLAAAQPVLERIVAAAQGQEVELDAETVRELRALGYVQ